MRAISDDGPPLPGGLGRPQRQRLTSGNEVDYRPVKILRATSIGYHVHRWLEQGPMEARIHSCFRHACNLVTRDGRLIALVSRPYHGPTRVVVPDLCPMSMQLHVGQSVDLVSRAVVFPEAAFSVALQDAAVWAGVPLPTTPLPDAPTRRTTVLEAVRLAQRATDQDSLASLIPELLVHIDGECQLAESSGVGATASIRAALRKQHLASLFGLCSALRRQAADDVLTHACSLIGLGSGLTPAGDDFLTGLFLVLAYAGRALGGRSGWMTTIGEQITVAAAGRTTLVSEHQLQLAVHGEADEVLGRAAIAVLWGAQSAPIAIEALLQVGSTSGGDLLAGMCIASDVIDTSLP